MGTSGETRRGGGEVLMLVGGSSTSDQGKSGELRENCGALVKLFLDKRLSDF
jgi:hypothetical protein